MWKVVLVGGALSVLVGCGGSVPDVPGNQSAFGAGATSSSNFHYPLSRTVTIGDGGFSPARLTVPVNTTIVWANRGTRTHQVVWTGGPGPNFASDPLPRGDTFSIRMSGIGTLTYRSESDTHHGTIQIRLTAPSEAVRGRHHRAQVAVAKRVP